LEIRLSTSKVHYQRFLFLHVTKLEKNKLKHLFCIIQDLLNLHSTYYKYLTFARDLGVSVNYSVLGRCSPTLHSSRKRPDLIFANTLIILIHYMYIKHDKT